MTNRNTASEPLDVKFDAFSGYGVAVRGRDDTPIPGEPFMSMADARRIHAEQVTALTEQLAEMTRERDALVEALNPFAQAAKHFTSAVHNGGYENVVAAVNGEDFRIACATLASGVKS